MDGWFGKNLRVDFESTPTSILGDWLTGSHLFMAPPQAQLGDGRKNEVRRELPQLVNSQGLSQDVSCLQVRANVLQVDISGQNLLSDEVIVHFDVLGPSMEDWVLSELNIAHGFVVEEN